MSSYDGYDLDECGESNLDDWSYWRCFFDEVGAVSKGFIRSRAVTGTQQNHFGATESSTQNK